ncbi:MAG: SMI1/KNR4 family protein [Rhodocyclaceae bacterium]|nr:SMI1/KNR4 family protein [Rhodocyclaceae bacterium]
MSARIEDPESPVDHAAISAAESAIGLHFPLNYREFLLARNGGRPRPGSFKIQWQPGQTAGEDWRSSCMGWFYSIGSSVDSCDLVEQNAVSFRGRLPQGTFAFGHDAGSNQLLLAAEGPFAGKVLFWCKDHEVEAGDRPGYDNVGIVAESLQDFLDNKLY